MLNIQCSNVKVRLLVCSIIHPILEQVNPTPTTQARARGGVGVGGGVVGEERGGGEEQGGGEERRDGLSFSLQ